MIPRRPLLWLTAALLFVVPTMVGSIAMWVPFLLLVSLLAKFWMEQRDRRLRSTTWKIVFAASGFAAVVATYGTATGIESGVSILVLLAALKILESHTARDFHILVMVGWVLCLCAFLMSQDFAVALCVLAAFILLTVALVQFHRRMPARHQWQAAVGTTLKLMLQALPLVLLLFFLFPRAILGLRLRGIGNAADATGFSGKLAPGSVASIATSDEIAFRVEFPDGNLPPRQQLYWRGAVLWQGDGLNWEVGPGLGSAQSVPRSTASAIRQWITVEPHAGRWLFALDRPLNAPPGAHLSPGRYISSFRPVSSIRRYEVTSAPDAGEQELHPRERNATLHLPTSASAETNALVQDWIRTNNDPRVVVHTALEFFRTSGFVYSMSPGEYSGPGALDELLFHRRSGFCEHYAAAFASLMRIAGIPARVVVGYLGGEFNRYGNYLLVRQSDAHAWCEVWLTETGWTRVDPTSVIAPERVEIGSLRQMLTESIQSQNRTRQPLASGTAAKSRIFANVRLAWDTVSYAWDSRVLSFDAEEQRELFSRFGLAKLPTAWLWPLLAGGATLLLGAYAAWYRWRTRPRADAVKELYARFCRKLAQLGATREAFEGPRDFAHRAAALLPEHGVLIERIAEHYVALRYGRVLDGNAAERFAADVRSFPRASVDS